MAGSPDTVMLMVLKFELELVIDVIIQPSKEKLNERQPTACVLLSSMDHCDDVIEILDNNDECNESLLGACGSYNSHHVPTAGYTPSFQQVRVRGIRSCYRLGLGML